MQDNFFIWICDNVYALGNNVLRYVALPRVAVARFFALEVGAFVMICLFIVALAKTVTPGGGPRREPGQAVAPTAEPLFSYPIVAPRRGNDIYRPVSTRLISTYSIQL